MAIKEMTRTEHIEWCKKRARKYLNAGDAQEAIMSMASDYGKHSETRNDAQMISMLTISATMEGTIDAARRFVEGFN